MEEFLKKHQIFITLITAIATSGAFIYSAINTNITKKEILHKNKIIATKNVLYNIFVFFRNQLEIKIEYKTEILKYFICLFLLKKEKTEDGFKIKLEFEDKETTEKMKKKIYKFFFNTLQINNFIQQNKVYEICKEVIGSYLYGDDFNENNEYKQLNKYFETSSIISLFSINPTLRDKTLIQTDKNTQEQQEIKKMLYDCQKYKDKILDKIKIESYYNNIFKNFSIPTYKNALISSLYKKHKYLYFDSSKLQIEGFLPLFIDNYENLLYLDKFNSLNKLITSDINDGVTNKVLEDFEKEEFYYLGQFCFFKKQFLIYKNKYHLNKFIKPYINQQDPMVYKIYHNFLSKDGQYFTLKKINNKQKQNNNWYDLYIEYCNISLSLNT